MAATVSPVKGVGNSTVIKRFFRTGPVAAIVSSLLLLGACASSQEEASIKNPDPPEVMYNQADALMSEGNFREAAKRFERVDRDHPYSSYARQSIVMAAYAHYKANRHAEAVQAAKRYTKLHPGTEETALAYHIIASARYDQIVDPQRDQTRTREALKALQTLVRRFPDSRYAEEARNRIKICRDILAASEMNVGRYYLERHNYLAAIKRFRVVITDYQTTAHVEEALMRITEAYMALGIVAEAQTAAAVLGHNFPDSKWYQHAYELLQEHGLEPQEDTGSWISQVTRNPDAT